MSQTTVDQILIIHVGLGFSVLVVVEPKILCLCGSESPIAVEVDEERVKELANGARCVSLSSANKSADAGPALPRSEYTLSQLPRHDEKASAAAGSGGEVVVLKRREERLRLSSGLGYSVRVPAEHHAS